MKKIFLILIASIIILNITACAKESTESIGIRGEIKEIYTDEDSLLVQNILVEGEIQDDTMYDSAHVTITNDTEIFRGDEKATIEDIEEGLTVEVVFDGSVAESYPVQGTAKKIIIIED